MNSANPAKPSVPDHGLDTPLASRAHELLAGACIVIGDNTGAAGQW